MPCYRRGYSRVLQRVPSSLTSSRRTFTEWSLRDARLKVMTVAAPHSTADSGAATSKVSAPVFESRCLYTHDLRRKQKRWQDGVLRFHTFNKRIMVYDTSGTYIGDKHWRQEEMPDEGEELTLDRGVIVQAGEVTVTTQTDISGLFQRKNRSSPEPTEGETQSQRHRPPLEARNPAMGQTTQPKHKALSAMLGKRQGPYGKATLPTKSPYELRKEEAESMTTDGQRAVKRSKTIERTAVTVKPLSAAVRTHPSRPPTSDRANMVRNAHEEPNVDLTSSMDDLYSDITLPESPQAANRANALAPPVIRPQPAVVGPKRPIESGVGAVNAARQAASGIVVSHDCTKPGAAPRPVERSDFNVTQDEETRAERNHSNPYESGKSAAQTKPLRIVKAPPRRMLMCVANDPVRSAGARDTTSAPRPMTHGTTSQARAMQANSPPRKAKAKSRSKSMVDLDDELDALENGESPALLDTSAPPLSRRRKLQRTTSATEAATAASITDGPVTMAATTRRSPLKKGKSLSTTDMGHDVVSKKSKASKAAVEGCAGAATSILAKGDGGATSGAWSVEAFDLFDWRPPGFDELGDNIQGLAVT